MSVINVVERSITDERVVAEFARVFAAAGGPQKVLRIDNGLVIGDFKHEHNHRHRHSATASRVRRCGLQVCPHTGGLRDQLNPDQNKPDSKFGWTRQRGLASIDSTARNTDGVAVVDTRS